MSNAASMPDRRTSIQRLRADGVPVKGIATQLGLTIGQVVYASARPGTSTAAMEQRLAAVRELSEQGVPVGEIAERLGLPYHRVVAARKKLAEQGVLERWSATRGKPWGTDEDITLKSMWADGRTPVQIASVLPGRSANAIRDRVRIKKYKRRHDLLLTCRTAALRMGVSYMAMSGWLTKGWIPYQLKKPAYSTKYDKHRKRERDRARKAAGRTKRNRKAVAFIIEEQDLYTFVADRRFWPGWSIDAIVDDELRAYAHEVRDGQDRWLTLADVAARYHTSAETVSYWIRTKRLGAMKIGPSYYIWADDLDGFVPPAKGPKRKVHRLSTGTIIRIYWLGIPRRKRVVA